MTGGNDNSFKLGGNFVAAMRLVGAARNQAQGNIPTVAAIFRNAQLSDMAREREPVAIAQAANGPDGNSKVISLFSLLRLQAEKEAIWTEVTARCSINAILIKDVYPFTPTQEALMTLTAKQSEASIAHNVVELSPDVNVERFKIEWGCSRDTQYDPTHTKRSERKARTGASCDAEWATTGNLSAYG